MAVLAEGGKTMKPLFVLRFVIILLSDRQIDWHLSSEAIFDVDLD